MNKYVIYTIIAIIIIAALSTYFVLYYNNRTAPVNTTQPITSQTTTTPTQTTTNTSSAGYITVVDFLNRTVKVPTNVSRIVAIGPGALRLVVYLNATDMVVGVEQKEKQNPIGRDYAMAVYDKIKNLPIIGPGGPGNPPNPEEILAVKPDLVIMSIYYAQLYNPDKLQQEVGAPVIVVDYSPPTSVGNVDLSSFYKALQLLGTVLHRTERAQQLINYTQSILNDLQQRVQGINTSSVKVYVGAVSYKGMQPFTATQSPYPPLWWLSTRSIVDNATSTSGFVTVDFEYIISKQPDVIFIDEGNLQVVLQDFNRSPTNYCSLKAFQDGRVYGLLPFNHYNTNLAIALADAYYIGKVLYPDRFSDINPVEKANEIFEEFLGVPIYQEFINAGYPGFTNLSYLFKCPSQTTQSSAAMQTSLYSGVYGLLPSHVSTGKVIQVATYSSFTSISPLFLSGVSEVSRDLK